MRAAHRRITVVAATLATTFAACLALASAAFAHPEGALAALPVGGFATGLLHPLSGLDHLLAMVAVGLWAAQRGGAWRWRLPLAFVAAMAVGSAPALGGLALPGVEAGLAVSVLVLGMLVWAAPALSGRAALGLVTAAAVLHGQAHGAELGAGMGAMAYAAGFLAGTTALHALGVLAGTALLGMRQPAAATALRLGGGAVALAGVVLVAGLL